MKVAILVEGRTDRESIRPLIQKYNELQGLSVTPHFAEFGGGQGLLDVGRVLHQASAMKLLHPTLVGAVVCKDMNCRPEEELRLVREGIERGLARQSPPIPIKYHFVRFELESWLAADPPVWERKFPHARPHVLPPNVLDECDPKETIRRHLRARGEEFSYSQHDSAIAREIDLGVAMRRCPNLREFLEAVSSVGSN